jgi:hypothetical protein
MSDAWKLKRVYKKRGITDLMRTAQKALGHIAEHFGGPAARDALNLGDRIAKWPKGKKGVRQATSKTISTRK